MSDQLAKYELHIYNDNLFIYCFIEKMPFQTKFEKLESGSLGSVGQCEHGAE